MKAPSVTRIKKLVRLLKTPGSLSYNHENKEFFLRAGADLLRYVAVRMGLQPDQYEVRTNRGGIAVSGEVTLHADHVYFQLSQSCTGNTRQLVRGCRSMKDYTGDANQWFLLHDLLDYGVLIPSLMFVRKTAMEAAR